MTRAFAAPRTQAGFSLVEMLVSLAVLGLLATMLSAAIGALTVAARRQAGASQAQSEVQAAQAFLRRRIEHLVAPVDPQGGGATVDLAGGPQRLDFTAPAPDSAQPDAPRRFRLVRLAGGDLALLSLSRLDGRVDAREPGTAGWASDRLLRGTSELSIQYYGAIPGGAAAWQDGWVNRSTAPRLVRIRVTFPAGDRRQWPDLVVRPRAIDISGCVVDGVSGDCGDRS